MISVIVPCYNSGKYIQRCINSILKQSYSNLEIIVIDDGSTDNSKEVVQSLILSDSRVRYFYQDNSGVSVARNRGLELAKGEYITFVDSDDTINEKMYATLISEIEANNADIAHCSYLRIESENIKRVGGSGKKTVSVGKEALNILLSGRKYTAGVWNKVFRASLLDDLYFYTDLKFNEDILFCYLAFKKTMTAVFVDECLYEYHIESSSTCFNTENIIKAKDCYEVSKIIYEDCIGTENETIAANRFIRNQIYYYRACKIAKKQDRAIIKKLRKEICYFSSKYAISLEIKKSVLIIKYIPFVYLPLHWIINNLRKPNWDIKS